MSKKTRFLNDLRFSPQKRSNRLDDLRARLSHGSLASWEYGVKLEDCKPGTRVRVYGEDQNTFDAEIDFVDIDDNFMVRIKQSYYSYHPQQLRKLVKRKKRPELMCVFSKDGKWQGTFFEQTPELIEARKQNGREVWIMRGVKKL